MGYQATGGVSNEQIVNLVMGRWDESFNYHRRFLSKVRNWYNLYRCIYTGERLPFKNIVMLPLLFSACWSDIANKAAISLSDQQIIEMDPVDPDSGPSAKRVEALINQQFFDMKVLEQMIDLMMSADIYGTGILRYDWRHEITPTTIRHQVLGVEYPERRDVCTFDGPDIKIVDILDFQPQAGIKDLDKMLYCHDRWYDDLDNVRDQCYAAQQVGLPPPFDVDAIEQLEQEPPVGQLTADMYERQNVWRTYSQYTALRQTMYAKPVEFIRMTGFVRAEDAPDGIRFREIILANRRLAVSNVPVPGGQLRKHFRVYTPMPDPHAFHGAGKVEMGATMAASANKLVSNRLDVLDLVLQPAIFAADDTELDTQNLVLWPGRVIKVHGDTGESQIRPLQWDLQAYPIVANEVEAISRYIDMGTGVQRDTIQGMLNNDRQTAREYLGRMEQARTRLGLEAKLFERQVIERLADDMVIMDRQYLEVPRMVSLIGSAAQWDPDTGQPLPPQLEALSIDDLNQDHRIRALGASNMLPKAMTRQDLMTALQVMSQNPFALQTTNWMAFFNKFWRGFGFNPREMMNVSPQAVQNNQAAAMQGQGGGQPGASPLGDVLGQMAPGIMGNPMQPESTLPPISAVSAGPQLNQGL